MRPGVLGRPSPSLPAGQEAKKGMRWPPSYGSLVAAERSSGRLRLIFRAVIAREDEKGVVEKLMAGATRIRCPLKVIEQESDLDIVLMNKVQTGAACEPAVDMPACSRDPAACNRFAGGVRGVIGRAGEVEKKWLF